LLSVKRVAEWLPCTDIHFDELNVIEG
jgi:hypothetical protein